MTETRHATAVALGLRGLLILGPSGAGKSGLALDLMALGAELVADDRVALTARAGKLFARAPETLAGLIEARGIGLLQSPFRPEAEITLAIDLGQAEPDRLPPQRHILVLGVTLPLVLKPAHGHLTSALLCYLKGGRFA